MCIAAAQPPHAASLATFLATRLTAIARFAGRLRFVDMLQHGALCLVNLFLGTRSARRYFDVRPYLFAVESIAYSPGTIGARFKP